MNDAIETRLNELRDQLAADNPTLTFVADSGVVWMRAGGRDYGMYSATITDQIVLVYENSQTAVHRDSPEGS